MTPPAGSSWPSRPRRLVKVGGAAVLALVVVATAVGVVAAADDEVRSVILINGDGMGAAHREAATLAQEGLSGALAMDQLPVRGAQRTEPDDPEDIVTDSAAAATAWATGEKTANGRISTTPDGEPLEPIGRKAARAGKATGLVTTSSVTDASPAAFFSSVPDRDQEEQIAEQYLDEDGPDVVLGGGAESWSQDLLERAEQDGSTVLDDPAGLDDAGDRVVGLFTEKYFFEPADEGPEASYDPPVSLAKMTTAALDRLSRDEDGFFLFVEDEGIDGMSHEQNGTLTLTAMAALDEAVQVARDYVAQHPDTLLIVTGDHETGGLTVENEDGSEDEDGPFDVAGTDRQFAIDWTTGGHSSVPTPVTAQGPGSERLAGIYPNTHLHTVLKDALLG